MSKAQTRRAYAAIYSTVGKNDRLFSRSMVQFLGCCAVDEQLFCFQSPTVGRLSCSVLRLVDAGHANCQDACSPFGYTTMNSFLEYACRLLRRGGQQAM
jgi:hypothetical protein